MRYPKIVPYLLLITAVFASYVNVFDNAFLFDDEMLIVHNEFLRHWNSLPLLFVTPVMAGSHTTSDFYRPLQMLLYLAVYQVGGLSIFGFHLLNILLHTANACLVYVLGRKMNFDCRATFCAALIWALHPIHTEAVTYMSGTADVLYSFFCLLGIVVLLPDFTRRKFYLASMFMVLGLLSKETAIVFPLLATCCLFMLNKDRLNPKIYIATWPLWMIAGIYLFVRFDVLTFNSQEFVNLHPELHDYGIKMSLRIYTFFATIPAYLGVLLWPQGLHMERQFPVIYILYNSPTAIVGVILFAIAAFQIVRPYKCADYSPLSWGLLWFMAAHFSQTGILIPVNALFLEHWMYLPSVGLALGAAQSLKMHMPTVLTRGAVGFVFGLATVLGVLTFQQNMIWHDGIVFYKNILDHGEVSVRAHNNLGIAYSDEGDYQQALEQFNLSLKLGDFYPEIHQNIASVYSKMPEGGPRLIPQEIVELKRALELDPDYLLAAENLAGTYAYLGDTGNATYYRQMADKIRKKYVP